MRIGALLSGLLAIIVLVFSACDDDLTGVGSGMLPDGDRMSSKTDTAYIAAKTVSLENSVYGNVASKMLGKLTDDILGTVKSEFLTEFYCAENLSFKGVDVVIDSVKIALDYTSYAGDSLVPMAISVYQLTDTLVPSYYTDIDPTLFCDMERLLGQKTFTVDSSPSIWESGVEIRSVYIDVDKQMGVDFYNESLREDNAFQNKDKLRSYFPGIYVTTTFGSGAMISVARTTFNVYYQYTDKLGNKDGTQDTIRTSTFSLIVTPEVIQINHVENASIEHLLGIGTETPETPYLYMKSPAGVCPSLSLPIKYIKEQLEELGEDSKTAINLASFSVKGHTQKEVDLTSDYGRPNYLLLIDKDSVDSFFRNKTSAVDAKTCTYAARTVSTNTYNFGNISGIINEYLERDLDEDPEFLLLPISIDFNSSTGVTQRFYNNMYPSSAILRSGKDDMRLNLIYSKFK
ncbi:DUF4270 domain-containing protein [Dysgonomonas sp. 216]|uniref:DUF4270 domain-containing protein n=1 Tax=Dysgonomonas sp. 216 TaxID=2302934 RepID=UPI0013CF44FF|nr:DUF4270 domain-containing protein [Dysgonomonas sp. 216]NDW18561.1 DUF4270 domain-containing protein [Dysgonomonas sp. 216]